MKTLWKMKGYLLEEPFSQNKSGRGHRPRRNSGGALRLPLPNLFYSREGNFSGWRCGLRFDSCSRCG